MGNSDIVRVPSWEVPATAHPLGLPFFVFFCFISARLTSKMMDSVGMGWI